MEPSLTIAPAAPDDRPEPRLLSGRVLARLIAFSFASRQSPAYSFSARSAAHDLRRKAHKTSFRDAFRDFAEAYFTLAREDTEMPRRPVPEKEAVEALARVLSEAVESGRLVTLRFSTRLMAVLILTSLSSLGQQVAGGTLSSREAAGLATTMLFDGLRASPYPTSGRRVDFTFARSTLRRNQESYPVDPTPTSTSQTR